jgi:glycosyltransferase involved in cell wall biosynthesis
MKIIMLTSTFPQNKSDYRARWILELGQELRKNNIISIIIVPHSMKLEKSDIIEGIEVKRFKYAPEKFEILGYGTFLPHESTDSKIKTIILYIRNISLFLPFLASMFISSTHVCRREKIDAIISHWAFPAGLIGILVNKIFGIPSILQIYGTDLVFLKRFKLKWLGRYIMNHSSDVIAISQYTKNLAIDFGVNPEKIKIVPVGSYYPIDNSEHDLIALKNNLGLVNENVIFTIHRLIPLKGTSYLIRAMSMVIKSYPNAKLIIGGEGPEKEKLEELAKELCIEENVLFVGRISEKELPLYYNLCDIYAIPSIKDKWGNAEGLGMPVIEAMSYGKPVVGFDVGGPKYTIQDGINGYSVEEKDWEEMGNKILLLLEKPNLMEKIGESANKLYEQYKWKNVAKDCKKVIKNDK